MDPTAPKDNSQTPPPDPQASTGNQPITPSDPSTPNAWSPIEQPQSGGPQPSLSPDGAGPILPGQFVITGDDTASKTHDNPKPAMPVTEINPQSSVPPQPETAAQNTMPPIVSPDSTAQDQLITPPSTPPSPTATPFSASQNPATSTSQPDPTPFAPPVAGISTGGFSKPPGSGIKKLRSIIIIIGVIILLMIIGAAAWFFFFANQSNQAATTENQNPSTPLIEQNPIPKRGEGGFNEIQENSTPSGMLQESTPAAPAAPNP